LNEFNRHYLNVINENGITPSGASDVLYGGNGNDHMLGMNGDDFLYGEGDNDTMAGGDGNDTLFGGGGDDRMTGDFGALASISGIVINQGSDYLDGGDGDDFMQGEGGADELHGGYGDDVMWGDTFTYSNASQDGDDYLDGEDGQDYLVGQGGNDVLFGGEGDDLLFGDSDQTPEVMQGNDYLDGENGDDVLRGYGGNDDLYGGTGGDTLYGDNGDDHLDGGEGDDWLDGGAGNDKLLGGDGTDELQGQDGNDFLDGGAGDDLLIAGAGNDILLGGSDNDQLQGGDGNDRIEGGDGDDFLFGNDGNDILYGGLGEDYFDGGAGQDTYVDVGAEDTVVDSDGDYTIQFGENINVGDIAISREYIDGALQFSIKIDEHVIFQGKNGSSVGTANYAFSDGARLSQEDFFGQQLFETTELVGTDSRDVFHGYGGDDVLNGFSGDDELYGHSGDDRLDGGSGDDLLVGGKGADRLIGGAGNDTYVFARGDGHDIIIQTDGLTGTDVIRFAPGISLGDVSFLRSANGDLVVQLDDQADQITVQGWYINPNSQIARIEFADGAVLLGSDLATLEVAPIEGTEYPNSLVGTNYADTVIGRGGDDTLDGGSGNDVLRGGEGQDTYILRFNSGQDTVFDTSTVGNTIALTSGLDFSQLAANRAGDDLFVHLNGSNTGMLLKEYYSVPQSWTVENEAGDRQNVEQILATSQAPQLNNVNTMWSEYAGKMRASMLSNYEEQGYTFGTDGKLYLSWNSSDEPITVTENISESSYQATRTISYFPDYFNGNTVTSISLPTLSSYREINYPTLVNQTAVVNRIVTNSDNAIIYGIGETVYSSEFTNVIAEVNWGNTIWTPGRSTTIEQNGFIFESTEQGQVPIGTVLTIDKNTSRTGSTQGKLVGLIYNNSVTVINEERPRYYESNLTTFTMVSTVEEVHAGGSDNQIYGSASTLADGGDGNDTIIGAGFAFGGAGDDILYNGEILIGGDGNDLMYGGKLLIGGNGDDIMDGGSGESRYLIDPNDSGHKTISDTGTNPYAYEAFYYASSGISDWQFRAEWGGYYAVPSETSFVYVLEDQLHDLGTWIGQYAALHPEDVTYIEKLPELAEPRPAANDYARLNALYSAGLIEQDSIEFGEGLSPDDISVRWMTDSSMVLEWGIDQSVTIQMATETDALGTGIELIKFHGGTIWDMPELIRRGDLFSEYDLPGVIKGTSLNDYLIGTAASDTFSGGAGHDTLEGGSGDDTYLFKLGDGEDTIVEYTGNGDHDVLKLGSGISASTVQLVRTGADLVVDVNGNDKIRIASYFYHVVEEIKFFSDGTSWDFSAVANTVVYRGTDLADSLVGLANFTNRIEGLGGDDSISGNNLEDQLTGGTGNDRLEGGYGNDTYVFNLGDGQDTIVEYTGANSGIDTLKLGVGLDRSTSHMTREGMDLLVGFDNNVNDSVRVSNYFYEVLENIDFEDGNTLDFAAVTKIAMYNGTAGDDSLTGISGIDNLISGGDGTDLINGANKNDVLYGGNGNDQVYGGGGIDIMIGGAGNDIFSDTLGNNFFNGGDGSDSMTGGSGNEFFAGGKDNDTIISGSGADIIAFNRGGGMDVVNASTGLDNTLSLGNGIRYSDLQFQKTSNDLILKTGVDEQITFTGWYASTNNHSIAKLQMIIEGTSDYDASSTSQINDNKVEQFDFDALVTKFDQARASNSSLSSWSLSASLLEFHLGGSDTAAIGGDIAYQYGRNDSLTYMSATPAQTLLAENNFGITSQNLKSQNSLQDLSPRLM
jgi:Ca2+-binding RTX toxin-like protein